MLQPHKKIFNRRILLYAVCFYLAMLSAISVAQQNNVSTQPAPTSTQNKNIEVVIVRASRELKNINTLASSLSLINSDNLQSAEIDHIAKALNNAPATWITQGSGQEHLTAIRSPVFTGAGACGNFIVAKDNIGTRASGFCNINQLFDLHYEAAEQIEITRGPSGFSHGGNALFGKINLITPNAANNTLRIQLANDNFKKLHVNTNINPHAYIATTLTDSGSFRDSAGFKEQKLSFGFNHAIKGWTQQARIHLSHLNQETAGFLEGENSYQNIQLRIQNANPNAYRDKTSLLAYSTLEHQTAHRKIRLQPYARYNDMEFLMHFLPWQPRENNRHYSLGLQSQAIWFERAGWKLLAGLDIDITQGELQEFQDNPSPFAQNNIPQGAHYDFDVNAQQYALLFSANTTLFSSLALSLQARFDSVHYNYTNNLSDGSACGQDATNCRFFRPSNRNDRFQFVSPAIELRLPLSDRFSIYSHIKQAHRAPQVTELYRLQQGQTSSDINEETLRSIELGIRGAHTQTTWHIAIFNMQRQDGIFLDSNRQVVFGENSQHKGIEWEINTTLFKHFRLSHSGTYAEHTYTNSPAGRNINGLEIDTAPRQINATTLSYSPIRSINLEVNYRRLGAYFLNPENSARYPGHNLLNAKIRWHINAQFSTHLSFSNLQNKLYAERADFAFGQERYFPGQRQRTSLGLNYQF